MKKTVSLLIGLSGILFFQQSISNEGSYQKVPDIHVYLSGINNKTGQTVKLKNGIAYTITPGSEKVRLKLSLEKNGNQKGLFYYASIEPLVISDSNNNELITIFMTIFKAPSGMYWAKTEIMTDNLHKIFSSQLPKMKIKQMAEYNLELELAGKDLNRSKAIVTMIPVKNNFDAQLTVVNNSKSPLTLSFNNIAYTINNGQKINNLGVNFTQNIRLNDAYNLSFSEAGGKLYAGITAKNSEKGTVKVIDSDYGKKDKSEYSLTVEFTEEQPFSNTRYSVSK